MREIVCILATAAIVCGCSLSHTVHGDSDGGRHDGGSTGQVGPPCIPVNVPSGGFSSVEVLVETYTPVCGEPPLDGIPTAPPVGVCVVYGLEGDPRAGCTENCADPAEVAERTFCSCRCDGDPGTGPFCTCPGGSRCERLITHGGWSGGAFCVPDRLSPR